MEFIYQKVKAVVPRPLKVAIGYVPQAFDAAVRKYAEARSEPLREAILNLRTEVLIARMARNSKKRFKSLKGRRGLKVNLGCGNKIKNGWLNIDLNISSSVKKEYSEDTIFIQHDLRQGLLLEENSCDFIYSSHFFEHLSYQQGIGLMTDCYRALRPEGVFRIALPDMREVFDRYLRGDYEHFDLLKGRLNPDMESETASLIDYVNTGVYEGGGHKFIYDEEKLKLILRKIGYSSANRSAYQDGIDPDEVIRRRYSFYIEAVK
jgi:predicted SAM-dependent methyltransferase